MPAKPKSAATAAVEEVADPEGSVSFTYAGEKFTYERACLNSPEYRMEWQLRGDVAAMTFLLGKEQVDKALVAVRGESRYSTPEQWLDFLRAVGEASGSGN